MRGIKAFIRAMGWIDRYSLPGEGIAVTSKELRAYPEVTGYYIPTLLAWKEESRARQYAQWLLSAQLESGAWTDSSGKVACVFDVGQIVRGLLALAQYTGEKTWDDAIIKALIWCTSFITKSGAIEPPDEKVWRGSVPQGVLLYSFEPLRRAAIHLNDQEALAKIELCIAQFLKDPNLTSFTSLSHFHAYIMEALIDLGHTKLCREGMQKIAALQRPSGAVPAYPNVSWICSTGLFQYAIVWYKLGENDRGHRAFRYAVSLQNSSGGWYGSYGGLSRILPNRLGLGRYFAREEIAWAVKYFLDAFHLMLRANFEDMAHIFPEAIDPDDGRYILVRDCASREGITHVLDAGCGKGRYLKLLARDCPHVRLNGVDISMRVMHDLPAGIVKAQGSLLALPFPDASFDLVYACESLEHAVHLDGALHELARVLRPGGTLCIIDKDQKQLGRIRICDWEQWFDVEDLRGRLQALGLTVDVVHNVPYEGRADGLFVGWIAQKK